MHDILDPAYEPTQIEVYYHTIMFGVPYGPVMVLPYAGYPDWISCWNIVGMLAETGRDLVNLPRTLTEVTLRSLSLNMEPSLFPVDPPRRISMASELDLPKKQCRLSDILETHKEHPVYDSETGEFYMCPGFTRKRRLPR